MDITPFGQFDQNEWFIIVVTILAYSAVWMLPRRLNKEIIFLLFVWGFTAGMSWDFTIGGGLFDFYDINDAPNYEIFDLVSYFMYCPFSYFFIYFYDYFEINRKKFVPYILFWSCISLGTEWITLVFKMVTYKNGYTMLISFLIYLSTQSATVLFYHRIRKRDDINNEPV